MKLINNILYIEKKDFKLCDVKDNTFYQATSSNGWAGWNCIDDPEDNRRTLVEFEPLPANYKKLLKERFGDNLRDHLLRQPIEKMVVKDEKAEAFFLSYKLGNGKLLEVDHVKKYTIAANWLNMLVKVNADKKVIKDLLKISVTEFFSTVCELIKIHGIDLPSTYRKLHPRIARYQIEGYESLISRKFGNSNTAKVNDELSESMLLEMLCHPNQYDDVIICTQYNIWAQENKYSPIVPATVGVHRRKNEHLIIMEREGNEALKERYLRQAKGFRPTFPMAMLESDDNHIDLQFIDFATNNKFTRYKAVVVIDSYNDYVLGYAYTTDAVTIELVRAAYYSAMHYIKSLTGSFHLPHEVKADNFGIATLQPYYEQIGKFIKTPVGSKHRGYIEPFFGSHHWKNCLKIGANNYTGNNMTAKTRGVNMEVVQANINHRPAIGEQSEYQIEQFFHRLRFMPNAEGVSKHAQWLEAWNNLSADKKRPITDEQFLLTFGVVHNYRGKGIQITNRGVEPIINNKEYSYDLANYNLADRGQSVSILYDPFDMSQVLVTNFKDIRVMAVEARLNSRALEDAHADSRAYLNSILQEKKDSVVAIGQKSERRKKVIKLANFDAEAVLQSGVVVKELRQYAEQKFLNQSYLRDDNEDTTDSILSRV